MDAFETFTHAGCTVKLVQDDQPCSPKEWDNLGILVALPRLAREYDMAHRETTGREDEAIERGGLKLLRRYLRLTEGATILPFRFVDHGSGGARIYATYDADDPASGFIMATPETIAMTGVESDKIEDGLRAELRTWDDYVQGNVVGYVVEDADGVHVDSCYGFYPDHGDGDGHEYARGEARDAAEEHERDVLVNAEPDVAEWLHEFANA